MRAADDGAEDRHAAARRRREHVDLGDGSASARAAGRRSPTSSACRCSGRSRSTPPLRAAGDLGVPGRRGAIPRSRARRPGASSRSQSRSLPSRQAAIRKHRRRPGAAPENDDRAPASRRYSCDAVKQPPANDARGRCSSRRTSPRAASRSSRTSSPASMCSRCARRSRRTGGGCRRRASTPVSRAESTRPMPRTGQAHVWGGPSRTGLQSTRFASTAAPRAGAGAELAVGQPARLLNEPSRLPKTVPRDDRRCRAASRRPCRRVHRRELALRRLSVRGS